MNDRTLISILLVVGAGITAYFYWRDEEAPPAPPPEPIVLTPKPMTDELETRAPAPLTFRSAAPVAPPQPLLPELADSDETILPVLLSLGPMADLLVPEQIIPRIVATVDGLTGRQVPAPIRPLQPVPGKFTAIGEKPRYEFDPENTKRYAPYVALARGLDIEQLVDVYRRYYPLFQEAYEELGYPDGDFHDRLLAVIDHLVATPEVEEPLVLTKPEAFYLHADPALESLSAGQKILLRIGSENADLIKTRLRQIRVRLTTTDGL